MQMVVRHFLLPILAGGYLPQLPPQIRFPPVTAPIRIKSESLGQQSAEQVIIKYTGTAAITLPEPLN